MIYPVEEEIRKKWKTVGELCGEKVTGVYEDIHENQDLIKWMLR